MCSFDSKFSLPNTPDKVETDLQILRSMVRTVPKQAYISQTSCLKSYIVEIDMIPMILAYS